MFSSWVIGFCGSILAIIGGVGTGIVILAGLVNSPNFGYLAITLPIAGLGSFFKYYSNQSVKVK